MRTYTTYLPILGLLFLTAGLPAQEEGIRWMTFEQLEDSLQVAPKKVFIDFYADWCVYCKKMDRVAFRDPGVVAQLNAHYYAVRMDTETADTIVFDGKEYINRGIGKMRRPVHEIPLLLASRDGYPFTLPAVVILDESFRVRKRYFEYLSPEGMLQLLRD